MEPTMENGAQTPPIGGLTEDQYRRMIGITYGIQAALMAEAMRENHGVTEQDWVMENSALFRSIVDADVNLQRLILDDVARATEEITRRLEAAKQTRRGAVA